MELWILRDELQLKFPIDNEWTGMFKKGIYLKNQDIQNVVYSVVS